MTRHELKSDYFKWLCSKVCDSEFTGRHSYRKLLEALDREEFTYFIGLDGNRAEDGIDLRYRFGYECGIPDHIISSYLDDRSCSILEMMTALSLRCEEHIMDSPEQGIKPGKWFWSMIRSLGLMSMSDSHFDEGFTDRVLSDFIEHRYKRNGEGGLFTVKKFHSDMRTTEIWCQMMWYLNELSEKKGDHL